MKMYKNVVMGLLLSTALAGCSMFGGDDVATGTSDGVNGVSTGGASTSGVSDGSSFSGHPLDNPASPLSTKVIYFAFDSSAVEPQYEAVLAAHGAYLAANVGVSVIVEGHADERGTREYNVALSEKRAKTVQNLLSLQGAGESQTEAVALGEEKPVAIGHDESAWRLNRRVELIYPAH
ncbi:peptidoglycan-associated lipoprotein [Cycloclasticus pugetii]|uniref:peptidoglycan-associated lipoprotein n=1 Tax=Cycloclasticus pugetii TaxID=34068 RepID=UPI00037F50B6|nr:OmpA family protein [Cycloclasticus pugetii]